MTMIVKYAGYPDRLACEECGCEVGTAGTTNWVAYDMGSYSLHTGAYRLTGGAGYRATDVDEPAISCDIHDGCRCHESALRMLHNPYDPR